MEIQAIQAEGYCRINHCSTKVKEFLSKTAVFGH
jgi:hypothetical protein